MFLRVALKIKATPAIEWILMSLFRLDASIFPATSASRALGDLVEAEWTSAHPSSGVVRRDVATEPVANELWPNAVAGSFAPESARTPEQTAAIATAAAMADELIDAEALLFNVPLYNYGVSQHFKTWFDLAYQDPRIGVAGTALQGKPATLITTLGGNYSPGTPKEGWDHSTPWIVRVLQDVWGLDLDIVQRSFTFVGVVPALDAFTDMAAQIKEESEAAARTSGRKLAESVAKTPAA